MSPIKQDGPYDSRTLTKIFAGASVGLIAVTFWLVVDDHTRAWKQTQSRFRDIEFTRAKAEVLEAERRLKEKGILEKLEQQAQAAEGEVAKHKADIAKAE